MRLERDDRLTLAAPFGLEDLFAMRLRPNPNRPLAAGTLTETTVRPSAGGVAVIGSHRVSAGEHRRFGPHYVHDLGNAGDAPALSVHVYGPRLTTMSYYELSPVGRLDRVRTEAVPPLGPFDVTSDHDPS